MRASSNAFNMLSGMFEEVFFKSNWQLKTVTFFCKKLFERVVNTPLLLSKNKLSIDETNADSSIPDTQCHIDVY